MEVNRFLQIQPLNNLVSLPCVINNELWLIDISNTFAINIIPAEQWLPVENPPDCFTFDVDVIALREMIASNEKHAKIKYGGLTIINNHMDGVYREDALVFLIRSATRPDMVFEVAKEWFK